MLRYFWSEGLVYYSEKEVTDWQEGVRESCLSAAIREKDHQSNVYRRDNQMYKDVWTIHHCCTKCCDAPCLFTKR